MASPFAVDARERDLLSMREPPCETHRTSERLDARADGIRLRPIEVDGLHARKIGGPFTSQPGYGPVLRRDAN